MVRLYLRDRENQNWFKQFWLLKKQLKLSFSEAFNLYYEIKRDHDVVIQACKNEKVLNDKLHLSYWKLNKLFDADSIEVEYGYPSMVDASKFTCVLIDYSRGYRIFISRL